MKLALCSCKHGTWLIARGNKKIGNHIHEKQLETHEVIFGTGICVNNGAEPPYETGVISIFSIGVPHEVIAGEDDLYLFAKFMPALC